MSLEITTTISNIQKTETMKAPIKTLVTILIIATSLNVTAQPKNYGKGPKPQNNPWGYNYHHPHGNHWGENVNINIGGGYPNYYNNNYGNGYNNGYYNMKGTSRNALRQSANVIRQTLRFSDWNDVYSPWLAKAIRHQQYAKQLYFWGDYVGALNHSERAGFLAWNTLNYFNNGYGINDGFGVNSTPDPYSDPNNPYYKQNSSGAQQNGNTIDDEDYGYAYNKKSGGNTTTSNSAAKTITQPEAIQKMSKTEIDNALPQSKVNDKELLKMSTKDLDIE